MFSLNPRLLGETFERDRKSSAIRRTSDVHVFAVQSCERDVEAQSTATTWRKTYGSPRRVMTPVRSFRRPPGSRRLRHTVCAFLAGDRIERGLKQTANGICISVYPLLVKSRFTIRGGRQATSISVYPVSPLRSSLRVLSITVYPALPPRLSLTSSFSVINHLFLE